MHIFKLYIYNVSTSLRTSLYITTLILLASMYDFMNDSLKKISLCIIGVCVYLLCNHHVYEFFTVLTTYDPIYIMCFSIISLGISRVQTM